MLSALHICLYAVLPCVVINLHILLCLDTQWCYCYRNNLLNNSSVTLFYRLFFRATVVLLPILGILWGVGLFDVNKNTEVFACIFTIINSIQVCTLSVKSSV